MADKLFNRANYPFEILSQFGLTEEMMYDLPDFVHNNLEMGLKSPFLPISFSHSNGVTHCYARISFVDTPRGMDVLFYPKLRQRKLEEFTEEQQAALLSGRVILSELPTMDNVEEKYVKTLCFLQYDKETNDVIYTPTPTIGRNLESVLGEYENLTGDMMMKLRQGEQVTVKDGSGPADFVTIGIDLFSEKGVVVVPGTAENWQNAVRPIFPEYTFGADGCWLCRNGQLSYVYDRDFDDTILSALEHMRIKNGFDLQSKPEVVRTDSDLKIDSRNNQMTL